MATKRLTEFGRGRITEVGGLWPLPKSGKPASNADGMNGPDVTLPNDKTDRPSKAFAHLADDDHAASDMADELAASASREGESQPRFDPTPIRNLLAKHGAIIAALAGKEAFAVLTATAGSDDEAIEESLAPWKPRPVISEKRLRSFAASLRE